MNLLIPLGLLGLLGLLILLLIYIIKPNFQQKLVSSTFIWKLSFKYQRKRIPISKFRNLLILLCQILIIALIAMILAQPAIVKDGMLRDNEKIVVIDASASMLATERYDNDKYTRFDYAVDEVIDLVDDVFDKNGLVTLIMAGEKSETLFMRVGPEAESDVLAKLYDLKNKRDSKNNPSECTYGSADIEGAMTLAENITAINPLAEVLLYTGKQYLNSNGVTVVDVSRGAEEINVAVLDVRAVLEEGYYTFYADIVSYGENVDVDVEWNIDVDVYSNSSETEYVEPVREIMHRSLKADQVTTVVFDTNSELTSSGLKRPVTDYVYEYVSATVNARFEGDAMEDDNSLTLYGGVKPTLKIQYASTAPSIFFSSALMSIGNALRNRWDVDIDEVRGADAIPQISGYDFYIFEHRMPSTIPTDGVVFLVNPSVLPNEMGIILGSGSSGTENNLVATDDHPLIKNLNVGNIMITSYNPISTYPDGYTAVMQCAGQPVFLSKNTADEKIAVMTFSLNYSDMPVTFEFPTLIYNMFEYFMPSTFTQFIFDVNDSITLNSRGSSLIIEAGGVTDEIKTFPNEYKLSDIGTYTTTQTLFGSDKVISENFFVKIPSEESNIFMVVDTIPGAIMQTIPEIDYDDLLVFFAAALVLLLFAEWFLQSRTRI